MHDLFQPSWAEVLIFLFLFFLIPWKRAWRVDVRISSVLSINIIPLFVPKLRVWAGARARKHTQRKTTLREMKQSTSCIQSAEIRPVPQAAFGWRPVKSVWVTTVSSAFLICQLHNCFFCYILNCHWSQIWVGSVNVGLYQGRPKGQSLSDDSLSYLLYWSQWIMVVIWWPQLLRVLVTNIGNHQ